MKTKKILMLLAATGLLGACASDEEAQVTGEPVPIRLSAAVEGSQTRAATTSTTGDEVLLDGQDVDAYIKVKGGDWVTTGLSATVPRHFSVTGNSGDLARKSGEAMDYYPMDGTPVSIYAVHPSIASAATFTVKSDQTDDANYAASDLSYCKTADYNRSESLQTLTFGHVLSKIIVNVQTDLGTVSSVKLRAKKSTTLTYPANNDDGYTLGTASGVGMIEMNAGGAAIIPPQTTAAVGDVRIIVEIDGKGTFVYNFPASTTFASNTEYTYTVKIGASITVTSSINPWGGSATTAEHSYTGYVTPQIDIKKNPLWYVAEYNLAGDNSFSKTMSTSQGYLFTWSNAMGRGYTYSTSVYDGWAVPSTPKTVVNETDGVTWHIPTHREFLSIIPFEGLGITGTGRGVFNNSDLQPGTTAGAISEPGCTFGYNNDTKYYNKTDNTNTSGISYDSYWSSYVASSNVRYAIRFLGTPYCSVWRYRVVDYNTENARLEISARLINEIESSATVALGNLMTEIMNKDDSSSPSYDAHYWDEDVDNGIVQRVFYACGFNYNTSAAVAAPGLNSGSTGWYWSTTSAGSDLRYRMKITGEYAVVGDNNIGHNFSVRLFRDN